MIEIYADVVFLINWVMDLFIFWVAGRLARKRVKKFRLVLGSALASLLYCILVFAPVISRYYNFFSSLIVLLAGILATFGLKDLKELFKLLVLSHISAFAVGGIGSALFYYTNMGDVLGNAIGLTMDYFSIKILIAAVCISYILIKAFLNVMAKLALKKQAIYNIRIISESRNVELPVLVDTGNSLMDPLSKLPVIIAEFEYIKDFLPDKLQELYRAGTENDLSQIIAAVSGDHMEKSIRMIPYKSLGNENGMLIGFKPMLVEVEKDAAVTRLNNVIIGIYNLSLTKNGEYHGLLNPQALDAAV